MADLFHIPNCNESTKNWKDEDFVWFHSLISTHLNPITKSVHSPLQSQQQLQSQSMDEILMDSNTDRCHGAMIYPGSDLHPMIKGEHGDQMKYIHSCKKKLKPDCMFQMCFNCCWLSSLSFKNSKQNFNPNNPYQYCVGHASARIKREEEDRWIRLSLFGDIGQRKKKRFVHFEDKFTDYRQTILIWYIGDFFRNKKWSEDTFSSLLKQKRQLGLRKKREEAFQKQLLTHENDNSDFTTKEHGNDSNESNITIKSQSIRSLSDVNEESVSIKSRKKNSRSSMYSSSSKKLHDPIHLSPKARHRWNQIKKVWESSPSFGCTAWILDSNREGSSINTLTTNKMPIKSTTFKKR